MHTSSAQEVYPEDMAEERKTQPTDADVDGFLATVEHEQRRTDAEQALELMQDVTGEQPRMWGPSMVGFGVCPYTTADGKQHEWFVIGLAPRKASLTLYGLTEYGSNQDLLGRLGQHTTGKGCVYVKRLDDVDQGVLRALVQRAWDERDQTERP
jgi:hypothetical protein